MWIQKEGKREGESGGLKYYTRRYRRNGGYSFRFFRIRKRSEIREEKEDYVDLELKKKRRK